MAFQKRIAATTVKVMDEGWAKIAHIFAESGKDLLAEMQLRRMARSAGVAGSIRKYCNVNADGQASLKPWGNR